MFNIITEFKYRLVILMYGVLIATFLWLADISFAGTPVTVKAVAKANQHQFQQQFQQQEQHQTSVSISKPRQHQVLDNDITYDPSNQIEIQKTDPVIKNSFNTRTFRPYRILPQPNDVIPTPTPQLFHQPSKDTGPLFVGAQRLVDLMNAADITNVDDDDVRVLVQPIRYIGSADPVDAVHFEIVKRDTKFDPVAFISVSTDDWVSSVTLAAILKQKAREMGASRVILIKEGVQNVMVASSKSLGLNPSISIAGGIGTGSGLGGITASGMGIASAKAMYLKGPFLQAILAK